MSICVVSQTVGLNPEQFLVVSDAVPCNGTLLLDSTDLIGSLDASNVGLLIGACAALYALTFVFNLGRKQLGF
jgi:hypothetical protein